MRRGDSYPFGALVGQDGLKRALLLGAVDPSLGGVLIRGEKGTAKSTAARALAALLPPLRVAAGCEYRCDPDRPWPDCPHCAEVEGDRPSAEIPAPHVDLPLGATEDRVLGTLDLERMLKDGRSTLKPGLLAEAHRGVLYVDEVNLLADHLVDALLDVAVSGINSVQRDGVAARHPARFLLVGSMNAEEGELRPQLLDRFGLAVEVAAPNEPNLRAEVVRRRLAFEADPAGFAARWAAEDQELGGRVARARAALPGVAVPDGLLTAITRLCVEAGVDGLRADIALYKAARALAALDGRPAARRDDVRDAAELVLPHRRRRQPFQPPGMDPAEIDRLLGPDEPDETNPTPPGRGEANESGEPGPGKNEPNGSGDPPARQNEPNTSGAPGSEREESASPPAGKNEPNGSTTTPPRPNEPDDEPGPTSAPNEPTQGRSGRPDRVLAPGSSGEMPRPAVDPATRVAPGVTPGRHAVRAVAERGVAVRPIRDESPRELAVNATVRSAILRHDPANGMPAIEKGDLHGIERRAEAQALVLFVVDTSGSMGARRRTEAVKAAALDLLGEAYRRRDRVAVVTARGPRAEVALEPTRGVDRAESALRQLPTGGRTPLAHALTLAAELAAAEGRSGPTLAVILTDGRANVPLPGTEGDPWAQALRAASGLAATGTSAVVFDTEEGFGRAGRAAELAAALGADHLPLARFGADEVRGRLDLDPIEGGPR